MVGVTIQCRFGNQFFQYFFIKALAEKHNTDFFLNESFEKFQLNTYFKLRGYSNIKNQFNKIKFKLFNTNLFTKIKNIEISDFNDTQIFPDKKSYGGYFQSELFFNDLKNPITDYIQLKKYPRQEFIKKYGLIFEKNKTITVHIRRGDYLNLNEWWLANLGSNNLTLPDKYYIDCLNKINNLKDYNIIFISDDIEYVKSKFTQFENTYFVSDSLINDFQMLMNADICILSNSSFSWWGAYLNTKKEKKIYCPKFWLGFKISEEYPAYIIPKSWVQT